MAGAHFTFKTTKFTDSSEIRAQNVNNLVGHTLGTWLAQRLSTAGLRVTEVYPEDYGWDFCVTHEGSNYICTCLIAEDENPPPEGHVGLEKIRSFKDRWLGRNRFTSDDAVGAIIQSVLAGSADVEELSREDR